MKLHILLFCLLLAVTGRAQQHGLDPSFNDSGIVIPPIANQITASSQFYDICLQPDGKIIAVGPGYGMRIMRFQSNGRPDSSFAINSLLTYNMGGGICTLLADTSILVAGTIGSNNFGVLKLKPNGTPDSSFGLNGLSYQFGGDYGASGIAVQTDGRVIVSGTAGDNFAVVRFLANGMPDSSFGLNGRIATFGGYNLTRCNDIALQPNGKILLAGSGGLTSYANFLVIRYLSDGTIDSSFNGTGRFVWQPGDAAVRSIRLQPDGRILLSGGFSSPQYPNAADVVMRLHIDGTLDTSFNHNGYTVMPYQGYSPNGYLSHCSMRLMADGRIQLAGIVEDNYWKYACMWRCLSDGRIDSSFCISGSQVLTISQLGSGINALALQSDGKIVTAGFCNHVGGNQNSKMVLARFMPDGNVGIPVVTTPHAEATIYPNPANNFFTVETNTAISSVRLTGIDGRTYKLFDKPTAHTRFSAEDIPTGTYFVLITIPGHTSFAKTITIIH